MDEIEVAPSAENGNVSAMETLPEAPSEQVQTETPAEVVETVQPTEPELFELPDGRKVDAETLTKEWKENFLPDYTRKSQELAKVKAPEITTNETPSNPYADPNYIPQNYEEIRVASAKLALEMIEEREQAKISAQQSIENEVVSQLNEIKTTDKNLNENALFLHATKYGFQDLKVAYQNMKDMNELAKTVQKTTANNIAKRNDPVSISPGATGSRPDPSQFATARDYLRSLK